MSVLPSLTFLCTAVMKREISILTSRQKSCRLDAPLGMHWRLTLNFSVRKSSVLSLPLIQKTEHVIPDFADHFILDVTKELASGPFFRLLDYSCRVESSRLNSARLGYLSRAESFALELFESS